MKLTAENVRDVFDYCPHTGILKRISLNAVVGSLLNGYLRAGYKSKGYYVHRIAWLWMTGTWPDGDTDHINHKKDDNRWSNLREVTHRVNHQNMKRHSDNTTGVTGVRWSKRRGKWESYIQAEEKYVGLYYGDDFFDAVAARKSAEIRYGFHPNHGGDV